MGCESYSGSPICIKNVTDSSGAWECKSYSCGTENTLVKAITNSTSSNITYVCVNKPMSGDSPVCTKETAYANSTSCQMEACPPEMYLLSVQVSEDEVSGTCMNYTGQDAACIYKDELAICHKYGCPSSHVTAL